MRASRIQILGLAAAVAALLAVAALGRREVVSARTLATGTGAVTVAASSARAVRRASALQLTAAATHTGSPTATAQQQASRLRAAQTERPQATPTSENSQATVRAALDDIDRVRELNREEARDRLASLRRQGPAALQALGDAYQSLPLRSYARRHGLVSLIGEVGMHAAEPLLSTIARTPVPRTPAAGPEDQSFMLEISVRYAALRGLASLTARGNEDAERTLKELIRDPVLSAEATAQYIDAGPDRLARQREAAALLPPDQSARVHTFEVRQADDLPPHRPDADIPVGHSALYALQHGLPPPPERGDSEAAQ